MQSKYFKVYFVCVSNDTYISNQITFGLFIACSFLDLDTKINTNGNKNVYMYIFVTASTLQLAITLTS